MIQPRNLTLVKFSVKLRLPTFQSFSMYSKKNKSFWCPLNPSFLSFFLFLSSTRALHGPVRVGRVGRSAGSSGACDDRGSPGALRLEIAAATRSVVPLVVPVVLLGWAQDMRRMRYEIYMKQCVILILIYIYTCIYIYTYMYTYIHIYVYYVYVYIYVICMYIYI